MRFAVILPKWADVDAHAFVPGDDEVDAWELVARNGVEIVEVLQAIVWCCI